MALKQDFLAGVLFLAIGAIGLVVGWNYETGTLAHAGAGLAPKVLCLGLIGLGAVIGLRSIHSIAVAPRLQLRPLVAVLGGLLIFAALIEHAGLAITVATMVVFMYFASGQRRWSEAAIVGVLFGMACTALFVFGLKLSFKPGWW